jgi:Protein of unknown function (DUF3800)
MTTVAWTARWIVGSPEPAAGRRNRVAGPAPTSDHGHVRLPPTGPPRAVVEIACDESGSEGEKLIGGTTDVFAHASLDVDAEVAAACVDEVRLRARSPAEELKASVVLRAQNRAVLEDLLGPAGPFVGRARVHLTDKVLHLVGKLGEVLGAGTPDAALLHREAGLVLGARWPALLGAFNDLMRARTVDDARALADLFFDAAEELARLAAGTSTGEVLVAVAAARPSGDRRLLHLLDRSDRATVLDPLVPALAAAVRYWSAGTRAVSVVHDEHRTLREAGLGHLDVLCGVNGSLVGIRFVDSRDDPRVQIADFLAGAARRIASDALNDRPDPVLCALLLPYLDPTSVWADPRVIPVVGPNGNGVTASPT